MAHSHPRPTGAGSLAQVDAAELRRHRRAVRMLVVVLIPLAIWTVFGLVTLWPGDISRSIASDVGFSVPGVTYPQARITGVAEISCEGLAGSTPGVTDARCADVTAQLLEGDEQGLSVTVPLTEPIYASGAEVGQTIVLIRVPPADGQPAQYQFSDFARGTPLLVLTLLFVAVVVAVARWRGLKAVLGLGFAAFILVKFMFPALVSGENPLLVGLIGSSAIMFVVLYAAHGFSARTTTALVGTLFGLVLITLLGFAATRAAHLTGVASEDDYVLAAAAPNLTLTSVVMCGIIVAGLGVLNDVTITQASAVWELADGAGPEDEGRRKLFSSAMRIGRDHIASTVYTIAFATAGASLSVLLLIAVYDRPLFQVVVTEQFAAELVRTLVGSIGLVLAVPLTTAIGVAVVRASDRGLRPAAPVTASPDDEPGPGEPPSGAAADEEPASEVAAVQTSDATAKPASDAAAEPADGGPTPQPVAAGGARGRGRTGEAETEAKWRRWRRNRPAEDDFGFAHLRDDADQDAPPAGKPSSGGPGRAPGREPGPRT